MNKLALELEKKAAKLALAVTKFNVNSCCAIYMYQPELPASAKKLKKF